MTDERHQQLVFSLGEGDDGTARVTRLVSVSTFKLPAVYTAAVVAAGCEWRRATSTRAISSSISNGLVT